MSRGSEDGPGRGCRRRLARAAALGTTVMAVLVASGPASVATAHGYSRALVVTLVLAAVSTSARIWIVDAVEDRLVAATLAGLVLVGLTVVTLLGGPAGGAAHWSATTAAAAAVALVVLTAVVVDVRVETLARARASERERPYAL